MCHEKSSAKNVKRSHSFFFTLDKGKQFECSLDRMGKNGLILQHLVFCSPDIFQAEEEEVLGTPRPIKAGIEEGEFHLVIEDLKLFHSRFWLILACWWDRLRRFC